MPHVCVSPFSCRWIDEGSEGRVESYVYAICTRRPALPRVVSEDECAHCPMWRDAVDIREIGPDNVGFGP